MSDLLASKLREEVFAAIRAHTAATVTEAEDATLAIIRLVENAAPNQALAAPRATDAAGLVERLRSSAGAFRENPIYTQDGDPVLLTVQADELDEAAATIAAQAAEIERLREVVRRYGDRIRMANADMRLQQAIDDALSEALEPRT